MSSAADEFITAQLRETASQHGWPQDIIDSLSAVVDESGQVTIDYPADREHDVMNLEFGTQTTSPAPAIRHFLGRVSLGDEFLVKTLTDLGVL